MLKEEESILLAGNSIKFSNKFGYSMTISIDDKEVKINQVELDELINYLVDQKIKIRNNMIEKINSR